MAPCFLCLSLALFAISIWGPELGYWLGLLTGIVFGLLTFVFRKALLALAPYRDAAVLWCVAGFATWISLTLGACRLYTDEIGVSPGALALIAAILSAVSAVVAALVFKRYNMEQFMEFFHWPMYRVHGYGPGLASLPIRGPALMIANHTCYLDPLWIGKIVPAPITPMMTSDYYDKPLLRKLIESVNAAIRVDHTARFRREAPELDEAVRVLDSGGTVVIFPEGRVKRSESINLHRFGQGVWRILQKRPDTPVFIFWIEGGWGSFFSYFGGRPMTNKRLDFWRPIKIGVNEPIRVDPEILKDAHRTRQMLMESCLEARRHLGLEPLPLSEPQPVAQ